jgi:site-specific DNA recombinase
MVATTETQLTSDFTNEWADIGYTRISDDRTGEAASPARQRRQITTAATEEDRTIGPDQWFEDLSKSAYKPGVVRPKFEALLKACEEHPVRRVWVLHDDRLIRDGDDTDLPRLIRVLAPRKIMIRCVEAADIKLWQAEGKMTARIRNAVAAYESERKKERVTLAAEDRARKGRFPGGQRRFGYTQRDTRIARHMDEEGHVTEQERPSGPLVLVPEEAQAIADGYQTIASGGTVYQVTRDWRARGLTGPNGAEFTDVRVRTVLLRPANAGLSTYRGKVTGEGEWPTITDPDTFATVKAILEDPARRTTVGKPAVTLLAGVLKCGKEGCGKAMNGAVRPGRHLTYRCREAHISRAREALDDAVSEAVVQHVLENVGALTRPKAASGTVASAITEAAELRDKIKAYQARAADFHPEDLAALLRGLRAKLTKAEAQQAKEAGKPASQELVRSGDVAAAWVKLNTAGKRTVIKEQVEKIVVSSGGQGVKDAMRGVEIFWRED